MVQRPTCVQGPPSSYAALEPLLRHRPLRRPCGLRTRRRDADCAAPGPKIISGGDGCSIAAVAVPDPPIEQVLRSSKAGDAGVQGSIRGRRGVDFEWRRSVLDLRHPTNNPTSPVTFPTPPKCVRSRAGLLIELWRFIHTQPAATAANGNFTSPVNRDSMIHTTSTVTGLGRDETYERRKLIRTTSNHRY